MFARIKEAFARLPAKECVFLTLTLDRKRLAVRDAREAFRLLSKMSQSLKRRLDNWMAAKGWKKTGNRYVAVVEAHRSGWPHMHWVLHAPELAIACAEQARSARVLGMSEREGKLAWGELLELIERSGWGYQSTVEAVRDGDAMAGYVSKLAGEADDVKGEVAKMTQLPHEAPPSTRRLRSGKLFLPKRQRSDKTGALVQPRWDSQAKTFIVVPMNPPKWRADESLTEYQERVSQSADVCYAETAYQEHEAARMAWNARLIRLGLGCATVPQERSDRVWEDHRRRAPPRAPPSRAGPAETPSAPIRVGTAAAVQGELVFARRQPDERVH